MQTPAPQGVMREARAGSDGDFTLPPSLLASHTLTLSGESWRGQKNGTQFTLSAMAVIEKDMQMTRETHGTGITTCSASDQAWWPRIPKASGAWSDPG